MVARGRLELPHPKRRWILNPLRLPIPPSGLVTMLLRRPKFVFQNQPNEVCNILKYLSFSPFKNSLPILDTTYFESSASTNSTTGPQTIFDLYIAKLQPRLISAKLPLSKNNFHRRPNSRRISAPVKITHSATRYNLLYCVAYLERPIGSATSAQCLLLVFTLKRIN